jgi:hypothetical protein
MPDSKTYLNVPYAQKDAAKALGARWDAANKKWYVAADKDIALFSQWLPQNGGVELSESSTNRSNSSTPSTQKSVSANNTSPSVTTYAADKNFVAYNGDAPPWD